MSLYAANNICKCIARFASRGNGTLAGIIGNARLNKDWERDLIQEFADSVGARLVGLFPEGGDLSRCRGQPAHGHGISAGPCGCPDVRRPGTGGCRSAAPGVPDPLGPTRTRSPGETPWMISRANTACRASKGSQLSCTLVGSLSVLINLQDTAVLLLLRHHRVRHYGMKFCQQMIMRAEEMVPGYQLPPVHFGTTALSENELIFGGEDRLCEKITEMLDAYPELPPFRDPQLHRGGNRRRCPGGVRAHVPGDRPHGDLFQHGRFFKRRPLPGGQYNLLRSDRSLSLTPPATRRSTSGQPGG